MYKQDAHRFHAAVTAATAVDVDQCRRFRAAAAAGILVEAAPDEVVRSPGARVVHRRAGELRRERAARMMIQHSKLHLNLNY